MPIDQAEKMKQVTGERLVLRRTRTLLEGGESGNGPRFVWAMCAATAVPWVLVPVLARLDLAGGRVGLSIASVALGTPHVATTAVFYLDREMRPVIGEDRLRAVWLPLLAIAAVVLILTITSGQVELWLIVAFGAWQLHHFGRQNLGVFAFLCRARSLPGPSDVERMVIRLAGWAGVFGIVHTTNVVAPIAWRAGAFLLFLAASWLVATNLPGDPVRKGALVGAVAFFVPLLVFDDVISATVGYGAAHGAQYLLMMSYLRRGRAARDAAMFVGILAVLYVGGGWVLVHMHDAGGVGYSLLIGVTAAHFLADARLWKMHRPSQRAYLGKRFTFT